MLEQVEIWSPLVVESDDFSIDYRVLGQIAEGLDDVRILSVEQFSVSGTEIQFAFRVDCDSPVSIEFSKTHSGPWGNFATARHSIGSMKAASRSGRDSSFGIGQDARNASR
jgi:hypothetical protein